MLQVRLTRVFDQILSPYQCRDEWIPRPTLSQPPMPTLPPEIWLEIFRFSTYVYAATSISPFNPFTPESARHTALGTNSPILAMRTKCALVSVCKAWRIMAIPLLYEYIAITSPRRADLILQALESPGTPGRWTRHVAVFTHARGAATTGYLQLVFRIFRLCPHLRILGGTWRHPLPPAFTDALTRLFATSIQGLLWDDHEHGKRVTPAFFGAFSALRVLDISNAGTIDNTGERPTLTNVQELVLSTRRPSLALGAFLVLPTLLRLTFDAPPIHGPQPEELLAALLAAHGPTLTFVDLRVPDPSPPDHVDTVTDHASILIAPNHIAPAAFLAPDTCPQLTTLVFAAAAPPFPPDTTHPALRRIGLRGVAGAALHPAPRTPTPAHTRTHAHLSTFTRSAFPALECVRAVGFLPGADAETVVRENGTSLADVVVWWAELFDSEGVDFADGEGVVWLGAEEAPEEAKVAEEVPQCSG